MLKSGIMVEIKIILYLRVIWNRSFKRGFGQPTGHCRPRNVRVTILNFNSIKVSFVLKGERLKNLNFIKIQ
ncbi:Conserved hypothetical protein [Clostridium acetobutylicum EA 2018]|uniref:Uncharacterized protein n=1 Tax=Clostridium acetobutylicum (strain ATCC 824 / DSM 792 / JCM 1419 / IAM 19013 / LMG 5710 / NBRC 13948 / NRRL B-527 / VKM B-1787 / 2291 / W) TaxID=272562 RepID=Q97JY4_CLOAB|nr:Hypothetical protein CA_C1138 [Clostridium acetobutylicum ATCC 824]ADZ20187.1 Conserved hypothetical protein [Clostridium acetobutylicum EA 2018]AEI31647.1 hypothetical protein SMB_G1157 [Clostridium acetobutylicum DSM 1731]AWV81635.1 hypothetical protein DK921_16365 [Clostridium acetobutylicum]PSM04920.1 hypothetical protein C7T89_16360 [Clostridium sp. NJ4]